MFNMAEIWGFRDDGTNPCRHIPKYPESGKTRLITDDEMVRLFGYLKQADEEGLEHPFLTLGIRLQFAFAARMSEIISLKWGWVDLVNRRIVWPDSKTGEISKPVSEDVFVLLSNAPRLGNSPYVVPSIFKPERPMSQNTYFKGWKRILARAEIPHIGTHGIRHRATTEIANSGVPVKVGMQLTAHKTVTQFMRYVHTEDDLGSGRRRDRRVAPTCRAFRPASQYQTRQQRNDRLNSPPSSLDVPVADARGLR